VAAVTVANVLCRLESSAVDQLNDWLANDYGLRHVFNFTIRGGELLAEIYKTNSNGVRYVICEHCGARKNDDKCTGSKLVAATESVRVQLTSPPPVPVISAWVK
jgi:hypothetical protein